jgi:uracil-DNA glycosylase
LVQPAHKVFVTKTLAVNEQQKQFLSREYQALWKAHGAMPLETRVLSADWASSGMPERGDVPAHVPSPPAIAVAEAPDLVRTRLVFVGDATNSLEDVLSQPFRGDAGSLLAKIIEAMGFTQEAVYVSLSQSRQQIGSLCPQIVVALGPIACAELVGGDLQKLRGSFHPMHGMPSVSIMPTFHPSHLLRTPQAKKTVWEDMKLVMAALEKKS